MSGPKLPEYRDVEGLRLGNMFLTDFVRGALAYQPKKGDLFIVTYPKCGTTWSQQIVYLIFHKGQPASDFRSFCASTPFLEMFGPDSVAEMPGPGGIKTHLPFHLQPYSPEAKYIYVARNPKDCCVSYYHHTKNMPAYEFTDGKFDDYFELFITGQSEYGDYFDNLLSWYEHRNDPNVLFLTYEDMKKDTRSAVLKMAHFIGEEYGKLLETDEEVLQNVLKYSNLDFMKTEINNHMRGNTREVVTEGLPKYFKAAMETGNEKLTMPMTGDFVRKGAVGDWRAHFSEEQNRRMDKWIAKKTKGSDVMSLWKDFDVL